MPSEVAEDYLALIYGMQHSGQQVIGARLAERLHLTLPTVTVTLKRMERDGLVKHGRRNEVTLTRQGQQAAESLMRRHALAERLLTDILGLSWVEVHAEAHKFEHIISPKVEARLMEMLSYPATCPHGNPIPGQAATSLPQGTPLDDLNEPGVHRVVRIAEEAETNLELMAYIDHRNLKPGVELRFLGREPFGGSLTVELGGETFSVGPAAARVIFVD